MAIVWQFFHSAFSLYHSSICRTKSISVKLPIQFCAKNLPHEKRMNNCKRIKELLQKNRRGISIEKIASTLKIDKSTVYRHLEHLTATQEAWFAKGTAYPGSEEETKSVIDMLSHKPGWFERRSRKQREQRMIELVGLQRYYKKRAKEDGIQYLNDVVLPMIKKEMDMLKKSLD